MNWGFKRVWFKFSREIKWLDATTMLTNTDSDLTKDEEIEKYRDNYNILLEIFGFEDFDERNLDNQYVKDFIEKDLENY